MGVRLWRGNNHVSLTHKTSLVTQDAETINYKFIKLFEFEGRWQEFKKAIEKEYEC